jgi:hypothetical protein
MHFSLTAQYTSHALNSIMDDEAGRGWRWQTGLDV